MSPSSVRIAFGILAVVVYSACGGGGGPSGPQPGSITKDGGDAQVAAAGSVLPESLSVIVRDQAGAPLANVNVTFTITAGGGSVSPASRATNAAGIAKTQRTLGPAAGTQTVSAAAGSATPAQFSAVSQINGAVNIASITAAPFTDTVLAVKAESLVVLVTNQSATPIPGISVAWAATGGSVSAASVPTTAVGESRVRFTYGTAAGSQSATATVTGLVGSPVLITFTAAAGNAVALVKTAGDGVTASPGTPIVHTVQSQDSHGNPKSGVTIDWALGAGGGSITPPQNVTAGAAGTASSTRTLGAATGTQTATATASGLPVTPVVTFSTAALWTVDVANFSFTPGNRTITVGDSVTWVWQGETDLHNVSFSGSQPGTPGAIGNRSTGSAKRTFTTAGVFNYACTNHPPGMIGTITVNP